MAAMSTEERKAYEQKQREARERAQARAAESEANERKLAARRDDACQMVVKGFHPPPQICAGCKYNTTTMEIHNRDVWGPTVESSVVHYCGRGHPICNTCTKNAPDETCPHCNAAIVSSERSIIIERHMLFIAEACVVEPLVCECLECLRWRLPRELVRSILLFAFPEHGQYIDSHSKKVNWSVAR